MRINNKIGRSRLQIMWTAEILEKFSLLSPQKIVFLPLALLGLGLFLFNFLFTLTGILVSLSPAVSVLSHLYTFPA